MTNQLNRFSKYNKEGFSEKGYDYSITIEDVVSDIEKQFDINTSLETAVYISGDSARTIKDLIIAAGKKIFEFIRAICVAIKNFFKKMFFRDNQLKENIDKTQEKIKSLKKNKLSTESISIENEKDPDNIAINVLDAVDLHDKYKNNITVNDFNAMVTEFKSTSNMMNSYFLSIDNHLKTTSEIKEEIIGSNDPSKIISQLRNKPSIPSSMRVKEFDFFRVAKIGLPEHFEEGEGEGIQKLSDTFKKNVPRLIKNVNIDPLNLTIDSNINIVALADKWYGDLEKIKSENRLSGQYLKMSLNLLEEKEKHFSNIESKISSVMQKDGNGKDTIAKFQEYMSAIKSQINYINMYINVMSYYHNATAKIANSVNNVINKLIDIYLERA